VVVVIVTEGEDGGGGAVRVEVAKGELLELSS
jgi:hypothetical protein